jgi:hypothetical protein
MQRHSFEDRIRAEQKNKRVRKVLPRSELLIEDARQLEPQKANIDIGKAIPEKKKRPAEDIRPKPQVERRLEIQASVIAALSKYERLVVAEIAVILNDVRPARTKL